MSGHTKTKQSRHKTTKKKTGKRRTHLKKRVDDWLLHVDTALPQQQFSSLRFSDVDEARRLYGKPPMTIEQDTVVRRYVDSDSEDTSDDDSEDTSDDSDDSEFNYSSSSGTSSDEDDY